MAKNNRSKLVELFTRLIIPQDRKDKIYCNGADNLYPERVERIVNNSVTAKIAANRMKTYLFGLGFDDSIKDVVVNPKKNLNFNDILNLVCRDISFQKGAYLHINYDIKGIPNYLDVLKFKNCRISEEDDYDYKGLVWYDKNWKDNVFRIRNKKNDRKWFYPYNPDINVINAQRRADSKKGASPREILKNYRGQVFFLNLEEDTIYPNSWIDAAYNDADTEHRISIFRNDRIRTGFMGANIVLTAEGDSEEESVVTDEELKGLLGSDNASNILRIETKLEGDRKLEDVFKIETIKSEVDTKQFQYDEKAVKENILNSYKVPKILVDNSDSSLFGTNGETLRVAQAIYQEETEMERKAIENAFNAIFKKHTKYNEFEIIKLIEEDKINEEETEIEDDPGITD